MIKHHQLSSKDRATNVDSSVGSFMSSDGVGSFSLESVNTPKAIIDEDTTFWLALSTSLDAIVRAPASAEILAAKTASKMTLSDVLGSGTLDL